MENTATETKTVQKYRHEAKRSLVTARERLALRSDETREVYNLLNGTIEGVIRGRSGVSQEEQVERLTEARDRLVANLESLPEKVEAAKASVLAQIEGWEASITEEANKAVATLTEAAQFAAERDFDAHQQRKHRAQYGYSDEGDTEPDDGEDTYDEEGEEF